MNSTKICTGKNHFEVYIKEQKWWCEQMYCFSEQAKIVGSYKPSGFVWDEKFLG